MTNLFMALDCTSTLGVEIPATITKITSLIYDVIKIGVPLLLILFGMWDFGKAVMAGKEDEIKSSQKLFVKRLISAAVVFLVFAIVELVIGLVAGEETETIMSCIRTILGNE